MSHRTLLITAVLAAGAGLTAAAWADIVAVDSGIAVKESDGAAPSRGMTMSQVASKFGDPVSKVPAVGNPPIARWEYLGFVVYFERDHVIHSVVSGSAPPSAPTPAAQPAATEPAPPAVPVTSEPAASSPPAATPAAVEPPAPPAAADPPAEP
jgi:hypothetical protein